MSTQQFKPGDKVEVIEDGVLINGQQVKAGEVFTVLEVDAPTGFLILNEVTGGGIVERLWRACGHSGTYRPLIDPDRFKLHEREKPVVPFKAGDIVRIKKTGEIGTIRSWTFAPLACSVYCPTSGVTEWFRTDELELIPAAVIVTREQYEKLATNQRDSVEQPDPPVWLRVGWWYAMDSDGEWWAFALQPSMDVIEDEWACTGGATIPIEDMDWLSYNGECVPRDRWQEACWQVTE